MEIPPPNLCYPQLPSSETCLCRKQPGDLSRAHSISPGAGFPCCPQLLQTVERAAGPLARSLLYAAILGLHPVVEMLPKLSPGMSSFMVTDNPGMRGPFSRAPSTFPRMIPSVAIKHRRGNELPALSEHQPQPRSPAPQSQMLGFCTLDE